MSSPSHKILGHIPCSSSTLVLWRYIIGKRLPTQQANMIWQYYDIPRNHNDNRPDGRSKYSRRAARADLLAAPAPSHVRTNGHRPHGHYDDEGHYAADSIGLTPLPGTTTGHGPRRPNPPVLWAYPGGQANFPYASQNRTGDRIGGGHLDPGPIRLVSDRNQNLVGVSYHPVGRQRSFERAKHRKQRR